jgi:hypothetical protein
MKGITTKYGTTFNEKKEASHTPKTKMKNNNYKQRNDRLVA